jgi:hypothetical protein
LAFAVEIGNHTHTLGGHTHTVTIAAHTHNVTIPNHTHNTAHGIYRGTTASSATVTVDGNAVDPGDISGGQFDATPYLDKDGDGKITRDTWHNITITPNTLTRIVVDIHKQTFINALSGGTY